eukprot:TRINITY_DN9697_c0_g1_i1.p1 TRINITY_DN9697_c0_g1~~TRINITY_DN9697_c0_g1_i1.p1  ORF type:complete len:177 (-),score=52.29 TRINITY_DN9697_c0_g1_i1:86-571(-)
MASFDRSQWNIFTCERVFEPPLLSSGGGASEERLSSLQSSISFPGLRAPSGDEIERPLGLSLGKIFVASISPLFGSHIQALQAAPADASAFLKTIETAVQGAKANHNKECTFILQWLSSREADLESIVQSTPAELLSATLVLNLLTFYSDSYPGIVKESWD